MFPLRTTWKTIFRFFAEKEFLSPAPVMTVTHVRKFQRFSPLFVHVEYDSACSKICVRLFSLLNAIKLNPKRIIDWIKQLNEKVFLSNWKTTMFTVRFASTCSDDLYTLPFQRVLLWQMGCESNVGGATTMAYFLPNCCEHSLSIKILPGSALPILKSAIFYTQFVYIDVHFK